LRLTLRCANLNSDCGRLINAAKAREQWKHCEPVFSLSWTGFSFSGRNKL
jgi:hypothetical protein